MTLATATRLYPMSLNIKAMLWYDLIIINDMDPLWDAVRAVFLDFFHMLGAEDRAWNELKALLQRLDETINRYHLRMLGMLQRFLDGGNDVVDALLKICPSMAFTQSSESGWRRNGRTL
jgi:hypothetical protein